MKWRSLEESAPETDIRPLREIFADRKELIAKYVPPETQAVHARAVAGLKQQRSKRISPMKNPFRPLWIRSRKHSDGSMFW